MFDILFGWRKASKCKKMIRNIQCRLKLHKHKRCYVAKQLRQEVAQLLKHGQYQTAYQKTEQLIKDENMVEVYDLLGDFCELIIVDLPYMRKLKDLSNDTNEAISTLIFSSARLQDLPELVSLRKLFGERYGQGFITAALELTPGNLVNCQIKESLCLKNVAGDAKNILLGDIARSLVDPGQLLLEYKSYSQEYKVSNTDVPRNNRNEALPEQSSEVEETEGKIVKVDLTSESAISSKSHHNYPKTEQIMPIVNQNSTTGEEEKTMKPLECTTNIKSPYSLDSGTACLETSAQPCEETINPDDIEEFVSPDDQQLVMSKSPVIPLNDKTDYRNEYDLEQQQNFLDAKSMKSFCLIEGRNGDIVNDESTTAHIPETGEVQRGKELCRSNEIEEEDARVPYSRAMTMPVERPNEHHLDNVCRSKSFPCEQPRDKCRHIHPKLPDYDDIEAKFMALKRDYLLSKQQASCQ